MPVPEYVNSFDTWYDRASVRCEHRRVLSTPEPGQIFFPPELVPAAAHPAVRKLGSQACQRLLVDHLHQYLLFTVDLEETTVTPMAAAIARGRSGLSLPAAARADAFKIVTDEAWHAQFSYDLIQQVEAATGVRRPDDQAPAYAGRLEAIRERAGPDLAGAVSLLFTVVSETLVSGILSALPHDGRLPMAVRLAIADHARDEGRHHRFFRQILDYFWASLSRDQRRRLGPLVPDLVWAFLAPDYRAAARALRQIGVRAADADDVVRES
jgi:hypothetical protein